MADFVVDKRAMTGSEANDLANKALAYVLSRFEDCGDTIGSFIVNAIVMAGVYQTELTQEQVDKCQPKIEEAVRKAFDTMIEARKEFEKLFGRKPKSECGCKSHQDHKMDESTDGETIN